MNWQNILLGSEGISFLVEIALRTFVMFTLALILLRLMGKRGIRQLSIFEMVMIIALGSAAGDPMIYKQIGIIQSLTVFIIVLASYKFVTYLITKSKGVESFMEGQPMYIIKNGHAALESIHHTDLAMDEFFAEMRGYSVTHMGQVKFAILETNGKVSISFYEDSDVKPGLPIWPEEWNKKSSFITTEDVYACSLCGFILTLPVGKGGKCPFCKSNHEWVLATESKRVR